MATVKWSALTSRGTVLDNTAGQMQSLASGGVSALGTAYDNTTNLDRWGWVEITLASIDPTPGALISVYLAPSVDGTDYDDGPASVNSGGHMLVAALSVNEASSAKKIVSLTPFALPPGKFKFAIKNQTGVALANNATNNVTLFTANETVA